MGEVWRADDLSSEDARRLEVDPRGQSATGESASSHESTLARQITHPAVCRVFDVGESEGEVFYSMELVKGEDLATLLRRAGRLPPERVRDIGRQLCDGLAAAHGRGVLHRDLKPANVLMDENGRVRIDRISGSRSAETRPGNMPLSARRVTWRPNSWRPAVRSPSGTDSRAGRRALRTSRGISALQRSVERLGLASRPPTLPNVDPPLERIILQALAADPRDCPARRPRKWQRAGGGATRRTPEPFAAVGRWERGGVVGASDCSWRLAGSRAGAAVDRPGHHRSRGFHEHHRRAGVRRGAEGGAGRSRSNSHRS